MSRFTLATLCIEDEPVAAIGVVDSFYLLPDSLPSLIKHTTVKDILVSWPDTFPILEQFAQNNSKGQNVPGGSQVNSDNAQLLTPIMYPNKRVAVGANYTGDGSKCRKVCENAVLHKTSDYESCRSRKDCQNPRSTKQFDWEYLSCRNLIPAGNELQVDLMRGKAQDTMAPCGPFIVPAKFLPDTSDLRIRLSVNDKPMMDASTSEMLYKCDEQLSIISSYMTLEPGDIVFTGSPSGSAHVHGDCWLKPGDHILAEIEGIGRLDVTMIADN
ncbi:uncharacterized protein Triagg1_8274 [Trichoderma aggressivum f. europaeum]|uniref:Fumarylacetoacetase-like C-terminal domain-containing protein n=1 Tax=Trichoderma aggressivum f. europaeum TaxID=173218 RepID=A0AAE1I8I4_9HYPO|nr:hypothetical protein Triagg1_8274 [Trichoderma aggressivum f. europaeum]